MSKLWVLFALIIFSIPIERASAAVDCSPVKGHEVCQEPSISDWSVWMQEPASHSPQNGRYWRSLEKRCEWRGGAWTYTPENSPSFTCVDPSGSIVTLNNHESLAWEYLQYIWEVGNYNCASMDAMPWQEQGESFQVRSRVYQNQYVGTVLTSSDRILSCAPEGGSLIATKTRNVTCDDGYSLKLEDDGTPVCYRPYNCLDYPQDPIAEPHGSPLEYQWKYSTYGDLEAPACYSIKHCECEDLDVETGACVPLLDSPDNELIEPIVEGAFPEYKWSRIGDLETQACYKTVEVGCGEELDNATGQAVRAPFWQEEPDYRIVKRNSPSEPIKLQLAEHGDWDKAACISEETVDSCDDIAALIGNPINCAVGTKEQAETVIPPFGKDGLGLALKYRSLNRDREPLSLQDLGNIGGWEVAGVVTLETVVDGVLELRIPGQKRYIFIASDTGDFLSPVESLGVIRRNQSGWIWTKENGSQLSFDVNGRITSASHSGGSKITYEYAPIDGETTLTGLADSLGNRILLRYGSGGRLSNIEGANGEQYQLSYHPSGALAEIQPPLGVATTFGYNNEIGYALSQRNKGDESSSYGYNEDGLATSTAQVGGERFEIDYVAENTVTVTKVVGSGADIETDYVFAYFGGHARVVEKSTKDCPSCDLEVETFSYNNKGQMTSHTDALGRITQYVLDEKGRRTQTVENAGTPFSKTVNQQWHPEFRLPVVVDAPYLTTTFEYDAQGRILSLERVDKLDQQARKVAYSYNAVGFVDSVDGPRTDVADVMQYEYDNNGWLTKIVSPLGHETRFFDHDGYGRPAKVWDANNVLTEYQYDALGRVVAVTVDNQTTSLDIDLKGNLRARTAPDGVIDLFQYDAKGRLTAYAQGNSAFQTFEFDAQGNMIRNARGSDFIAYQYDASGNKVFEQKAGQDANTFDYDSQGRLLRRLEAGQYLTSYEYDAFDQVEKVTDPLLGETHYEYDLEGRITAVTDAENNTTRYQYNGFGEVLEEDSPNRGVIVYTYDEAGNVTTRTDAKGVTTYYVYDAENRLTKQSYSESFLADLGLAALQDTDKPYLEFEYDVGLYGKGRLTGVTGRFNNISHEYDARGNRISTTREILGRIQRTEWAYNGANRLIGITYPSGREVSYELDYRGYISAISAQMPGGLPTPIATDIEYEPYPDGRWTSYNLATAEVASIIPISRTFNEHGQLDGVELFDGLYSQLLGSYSFEYDARGMLNKLLPHHVSLRSGTEGDVLTEPVPGVTLNQVSTSYQYDSLGRLSNAQGPFGVYGYSYDQVGNRLQKTTDDGDTLYGYASDSQQLVSVTTQDKTLNLSYDANGNLLSNGELSIQYDETGRASYQTLVSVDGIGALAQHFAPEGWRDTKLGLDGINLFNYDSSGALLSEESLFIGLANQELRHPLGRLLVAQLVDALIVAEPELIDVVTQTGQTLGALLEGLKSNDGSLTDALIDFLPVLFDSANGLIDTLPESAELIAELARAESENRLNPQQTDYIYLQGQPIAMVAPRVPGGPSLSFSIINDHLGSPIQVLDSALTTVWAPVREPFGGHFETELVDTESPTQESLTADLLNNTGDVTADTLAFDFRLRFPGQYYDRETRLHYNYFRDYDPSLGRYLQSDPTGAIDASMVPQPIPASGQGGHFRETLLHKEVSELNHLYGYANQNPSNYSDSLGLRPVGKGATLLRRCQLGCWDEWIGDNILAQLSCGGVALLTSSSGPASLSLYYYCKLGTLAGHFNLGMCLSRCSENCRL